MVMMMMIPTMIKLMKTTLIAMIMIMIQTIMMLMKTMNHC